MFYDINKLPDFYSVRSYEQIDYSFENMEGMKCFCFFDNGFSSNVIEPNKRDIKFIWDGFILFVDASITLEDMRCGVNLYDARLVAFQRTSILGEKSTSDDVRNYVLSKLREKKIEYQIMEDTRITQGYPSKSDLWSTRDVSVLIDAIDATGEGDAYYFRNKDFKFEITFDKSNIPSFLYSHLGAIVLRGNNSVAISRLLSNDEDLLAYIDAVVGAKKIYSHLEGKYVLGNKISNLEGKIRKI